jgi:hypothetical protein
MGRLWQIGVLSALLLGTVLRAASLGGEFWLDEIWSWDMSRQAGSFWGIFSLHHDNNHHLNTLWLMLCPDGASWTLYRLHSFIAGLVTIILAAVAGRRWGDADGVFAAFLTAGCCWLVLFSTEARGYSLAACFALAAFLALAKYLESGSHKALGLFWLSAIAGFLSHVTFVHAYFGFIAWTLRCAGKERTSALMQVRRLMIEHGVPGIFCVIFYLVSIRGMDGGGGPPARTSDVITRLVSMGLGGPPAGLEAAPWLIGAAVLFGLGIWLLSKQPGEEWVFFTATVVVSPGLFLIFRKQEFLFERYFLIPFVFFLVLSGHVLGAHQRWASERMTRSRNQGLIVILFFVVLAGDVWRVRLMIDAGRGQFQESLAWVIEHDPGAVVAITGDYDDRDSGHDFRVRKYVEFYARYLNDPHRVVYLSHDGLPAGEPSWLLIHRLEVQPVPDLVETDAVGNRYELAQSFPTRGLGTWGWFVYRRMR